MSTNLLAGMAALSFTLGALTVWLGRKLWGLYYYRDRVETFLVNPSTRQVEHRWIPAPADGLLTVETSGGEDSDVKVRTAPEYAYQGEKGTAWLLDVDAGVPMAIPEDRRREDGETPVDRLDGDKLQSILEAGLVREYFAAQDAELARLAEMAPTIAVILVVGLVIVIGMLLFGFGWLGSSGAVPGAGGAALWLMGRPQEA